MKGVPPEALRAQVIALVLVSAQLISALEGAATAELVWYTTKECCTSSCAGLTAQVTAMALVANWQVPERTMGSTVSICAAGASPVAEAVTLTVPGEVPF